MLKGERLACFHSISFSHVFSPLFSTSFVSCFCISLHFKIKQSVLCINVHLIDILSNSKLLINYVVLRTIRQNLYGNFF